MAGHKDVHVCEKKNPFSIVFDQALHTQTHYLTDVVTVSTDWKVNRTASLCDKYITFTNKFTNKSF